VSAHTKQAPLLLQPSTPLFSHPHTGLWLRKDHWPIRSACIANFTAFSPGGRMPLVKTDWSASRDVEDHSRQITDPVDGVQRTAWKPVGASHGGHVHEVGFDEELDPDVLEDGEFEEFIDEELDEDEDDEAEDSGEEGPGL
jgi:hypothetical protein